MSFLSSIFGDANARQVRSLQTLVDGTNALEGDFKSLSDEQLKSKTEEFKERLSKNETLDDILPEAFAAVREASCRVSGKRHFDVQLMGGIMLHKGAIAEMRTGEGKTLVATLPAYLNALGGKGVHVVTVNDYLARRDAIWMGQIYHALGLSTACINHDSSYVYDPAHESAKDPANQERDLVGGFRVVHEFLKPVARRDAYNADITYGTNNEYGFDYLRDNLVYEAGQMVQRPHNFAIVDEVDSILIDEARTPLIISAPDEDSGKLYEQFARVAPRLVENEDYTVDEKLRSVSISEKGIEKVEKALSIPDIYAEGGTRYAHHLEQALKAQVLFKRDKHYVVKDNEVIIVDEFTGRLMPGRRWSEGLHQAVEAKEGVTIQKESRTLATITFQNYFRLYKKLSGMTGTARTSAEEFHKVYNLEVVTIPTNKPMVRQDAPDRIYKTETGKFRAIAREIKERNDKGQPVLVGTASIDKNELLATLLEQEGIPHNVLNAKNHEREAEIIAQAGRKGGVTVATNMAGRGVDIILGGNPPLTAEAEQVRGVGGLHVIGTERHEARRIDDQLRGRSGRQGDPGSSQFFISTEDEVVRIFGGDRLKNIMNTLGVGEEDVIENRFVSSAIGQAQMRIEGHNFDIRKYVLEYDDVVNKHREAVYRLRTQALTSPDAKPQVLEYLLGLARQIVRAHSVSETGQWNISEMTEALVGVAPFGDDLKSKLEEFSGVGDIEGAELWADEQIKNLYEQHEQKMGAERLRTTERLVLLRTIDEFWMEHIETLQHLQDSVRLRAYGQRDPLVEYKIEAQGLFDQLLTTIKARVASIIFKVTLNEPPSPLKGQEVRPEPGDRVQGIVTSNRQESKPSTLNPNSSKEPGRNDPCYCGAINPATGQVYKYKKCGLINAPHHKV